MFTRQQLGYLLTLTIGLVTKTQAQPFGPPQPGYPQPVAPQAAVAPAAVTPAAFPQAGYPPAGYPQPVVMPSPVVVPEPPVRLGFQFVMCDYGMAVSAIRDGGLAQQVGLLPGDIIVQMNTFQITGWDQYCLALHDAVFSRGGQVEMWLYRPTPAGYELQYVAFTIHEEQIIVVVPCSYHYEKCHSHHVSCWNDRLVYLNHCWQEHCHDGKAHNHHGLNLNFLGKGANLNFNKGGLNVNLGNLMQNQGKSGFGGQFGNFKPQQFQNQIKQLNGGNHFQKQIQSQFNHNFKPKFNNHGNHNSNHNSNSSHFRSSNGGGSNKNSSSQFSRSHGSSMMKSFSGFGKK